MACEKKPTFLYLEKQKDSWEGFGDGCEVLIIA
jgi:hypothetical protein